MNYFQVIFFLLGLCTFVTAVDRTLEPRAVGTDVVDASVDKILRSGIFPDDFGLLRRLAHVETQDGLSNTTFTPGWYGGIWSVSDLYLYRTKEPSLSQYHDLIRARFGLTWSNLPWENMTVPLNSAIGARLYIAWLEEQLKPLTPPQTLDDQADLWLEWYNRDATLNKTYFVDETVIRENQAPTCTGKMDLVVALMGTPDLNGTNYELCKNFTVDLIRTFSLDRTRLGFITYGTNATVHFDLDSGLSLTEMTTSIQAAGVPAGADNTFSAILEVSRVFNASKSRPGIPRVMVLFSGAAADDLTIKNESLLTTRTLGIANYPAGFSSRVGRQELEDIAYNIKTNAFRYDSIEPIQDFYYQLKSAVCKVHQTPALDTSVADILGPGETRYYKYSGIPTEGITLFRSVLEGDVTAYFSYSESTPSSAIYDGTLTTKVTFIASRGASTNVFITVRGSSSFERNNFVLEGMTGALPCNNVTRVEL